jgi:antitoxin component YwqK of YwqJK toxin-antitoxin module
MNPFDEFDIIKERVSYNVYMETEFSNDLYELMDEYENEFNFDKENTYFIIKKMVFTKNKLLHGEYNLYLDCFALQSPKLIMKANYNYGLLEGKELYYNSKGNIYRSNNYVNGNLHGLSLDYDYETGDLTRECTFHRGKINGKTINYEDNVLKEIATYSYDKQNGYTITFHESGYIESIEETYNDKNHGSYIEYEDLEEAIENKHIRGGITAYPKVITYQKYIHGVGCIDDKNKKKGQFELYAIGTNPQEDNHYFKEFYVELYEKYKNIVHMNIKGDSL